MIGSLGAVLIQITRNCLLQGGCSTGIAISGLAFSRISYFWSPAFWGAFLRSRMFTLKGLPLLCLIILACVIALAAGLASAVLMLPRIGQSNIDHALKGTHPLTQDALVARQTWHDFNTDLWLNNSAS